MENYADRLTRWMESEERREQDAIADKLTAAMGEKFLKAVEENPVARTLEFTWEESEAMRDFRTRLKNDPFTRHPDDPE